MAGFHVLVFCLHYGVLHQKSVMGMTKFIWKQSPNPQKSFSVLLMCFLSDVKKSLCVHLEMETNFSDKLTLTTDSTFIVSAYCPWSHLWKKKHISVTQSPNIKLSSCVLPGWLLSLYYLNYTSCHGMLLIMPSTNNSSVVSLLQPRDGNALNSHFCFCPFWRISNNSLNTEMEIWLSDCSGLCMCDLSW